MRLNDVNVLESGNVSALPKMPRAAAEMGGHASVIGCRSRPSPSNRHLILSRCYPRGLVDPYRARIVGDIKPLAVRMKYDPHS